MTVFLAAGTRGGAPGRSPLALCVCERSAAPLARLHTAVALARNSPNLAG